MSDVFKAYKSLRQHTRPISDKSNEFYLLRMLEAFFGGRDALNLNSDDLVGYCSMRIEEGAGPYSCNMEMSKLGTVMRYGAVGLRVTLPEAVSAARPLLSHMGLIGGGGKRDRRPTEDELHHLVHALESKFGQKYADAARFAAITAMRRGEIVKLLWSDVDEIKKMVLVRNRKDPRKKIGNDQWIPLLGDSWDILQKQPRDSDRIFAVHEQTLSKYFKAACDSLGIVDLHFHDLRHEGTSKLFEEGYQIQQVALVTGHKDWRHLRRYTNLKPEDLHNPDGVLNEAPVTLRKALGSRKTFVYVYDYGDNWSHKVKVEKIINLDAPISSAICLDGQNACPPEDVGGAPGYADFLEALADPANPEHEELKEWVGGSFDPVAFDVADVNERLNPLNR